jgi:hypothetical protein
MKCFTLIYFTKQFDKFEYVEKEIPSTYDKKIVLKENEKKM